MTLRTSVTRLERRRMTSLSLRGSSAQQLTVKGEIKLVKHFLFAGMILGFEHQISQEMVVGVVVG